MRLTPPLSLYLHVPWCVRKCPYCDFNSHVMPTRLPEERYLTALRQDLEMQLPRIWGRTVETVFFGGGTPSVLSPEGVGRLLEEIRALVPLAAGAEITLEANPGTVDAERFRAFRAAGINRLSVGIQSFSDDQLKLLGRMHGSSEAHRAAEAAATHFERFNLDLMVGLPEQTIEGVYADVAQALQYAPSHLSCYQLTLEPHTPFYHHPPPLPDADTLDQGEQAAHGALLAAGYEAYETSAWARGGDQCRHNLNYWCFGDYLGLGAGAHGKLSGPWGIERQRRARQPEAYMRAVERGVPIEESLNVAAQDLPFEFMMNALRLSKGVPREMYERHTGLSLQELQPLLSQLEEEGWLEANPHRLCPTFRGQRFLNDLLQRFLP
ncbi:radical SAM family heme chaperone HemW [Ferrovum myxofaciens]|uniref:Heme chaperone HemW n=1 Tax=Ferrovum myxofaciens TaxID=416213 RepID=A0A9E6SWU0_9PROT|nr:radical SAM family heme chaperone HemW [Ferrovum myxofaciens]QKE38653.2 MAG: oxygen-independent coproporphyrinogen III oxidase-like protein [Ferrovum myxofaciens]QWY73856.1 MAG: oxygen-independent coproporphyrinogen III oxidase-like protein [Ferrovum myxofaciens]QWY76610.1 MAG: oxygen-independent coproporphyrinogen III oxidase-like protein [Ferrovum myxofaciens]